MNPLLAVLWTLFWAGVAFCLAWIAVTGLYLVLGAPLMLSIPLAFGTTLIVSVFALLYVGGRLG